MNRIHYLYMLLGCILTLSFTACEEDANIKEYSYPEAQVESMFPESGYAGTAVTISGKDFGEWTQAIKLTLNGKEISNVISCQDDKVVFEIPEGAESGYITFKHWKQTIEDIGYFTVIPTPKVSAMESDNVLGGSFAEPGNRITLQGTDFGTDASIISITVNGVAATVESITNTRITFIVPDGFTPGKVILKVRDLEIEAGALLDANTSGDVTSFFLKNAPQPFERLTAGDSEYTQAKGWNFDAEMNAGRSLYFSDAEPDGLLHIQAAKSNSGDGQMYQETTLPPGEYTFEVYVHDESKTSGRYGVRFAVAKAGADFPTLSDKVSGKKGWNFTDMSNILTDMEITGTITAGESLHTCTCTLTEATKVRIGFAEMIFNGQYVNVSQIKIIKK